MLKIKKDYSTQYKDLSDLDLINKLKYIELKSVLGLSIHKEKVSELIVQDLTDTISKNEIYTIFGIDVLIHLHYFALKEEAISRNLFFNSKY